MPKPGEGPLEYAFRSEISNWLFGYALFTIPIGCLVICYALGSLLYSWRRDCLGRIL